MNILLINMPIRVQAKPNVVPTGIGILSTLIKEAGHNCDIIDLNIHRPVLPMDQVKKQILSTGVSYDIVGLSGMITTLAWQKKIARLVRQLFPDTLLLSGGGLASDFGKTLFEWLPEIDTVCMGEGENIFPQILAHQSTLRKEQTVLGPNPPGCLDTLPKVDWHAFDMDTYLANTIWGSGAGNSSWTPFESKKSINLISSRGCPYACRFCDRNTTGGRNYRLASDARLMQDIHEVMQLFAPDFIGFVDDNFLADKARLLSFLPKMKKVGVQWGCHGRLNEIDEKVVAKLKESGCVYIGFGGESADETVLKSMNKKNNPTQMSASIKLCQQYEITPNCTWIMGYPGETRASLRQTIEFIQAHNLSQQSMFVATAYPGTDFFDSVQDKILSVYETLEEYVLDLDDATKLLTHNNKILNYSLMSDDEFIECRQYVLDGELTKV